MKFPRTAKIFRGPFDAASMVGVFFLLLIFILLASLVYTPGIPIQLSDDASFSHFSSAKKMVSIARNGEITFENQIYKLPDLDRLRSELKKTPIEMLVLHSEPGAPREIVNRFRDLTRIELPNPENFSGSANPTVMVAVNLVGQIFFENQRIIETDLEKKLKSIIEKNKQPMTLVVWADKSESEIIVRLGGVARRAGFKEMLIATRPPPFSKVRHP